MYKQYFGLGNLDAILENRYLNYDNGYFVELGANDGINQSNTLYFEKYRNWHGILVEPVLHNFLLCKKHRSIHTKIYCNACCSLDYKEKYIEIIYSNLMSVPKGVETDVSDANEHARIGKQYLAPHEENISFGAVAITLNQILKNSKAPSLIDLLSLDVEGAEIEVLKGINHEEYKFKYMLIENRNLPKLANYLDGVGYKYIENINGHDFLFKLKN